MKVIIIAGQHALPVEAAKSLIAQGHEVHAIAYDDETERDLTGIVAQIYRYGFTQVGAQLKLMRKLGIEALLFIGKFHKLKLDRKQIKFDAKAIWMLARLKDRRDDTIMLALVAEVEKQGIKVLSQAEVLPELLISKGIYTKTKPTAAQMDDIKFGYKMAKEIAGLDIGQTIIINKKNVIAVEAAEGTDACIIRAGELLPDGGFTLMKVAKPQQDDRFDIPTIGMTTLKNMATAKGSVIAFEANKTFVIDKEACINFLDQQGIVLLGYDSNMA